MKSFKLITSFLFLALTSFILMQCTKDNNNKDPEIAPGFNLYKIIDGKEIHSLIKTNDGGYAGIAFYMDSVRVSDYEIIKFDSSFNILWDRTYGRSYEDYVRSILQTDDGGYIVIGESDSIINNYPHMYIWACRLDAEGELVWDKIYGNPGNNGITSEKSIIPTDDGGFIFTGHTSSDIEDEDIWVVKINAAGEIVFEKTFNDTGSSEGQAIIETNGNYAILVSVIGKSNMFSEDGIWILSIDKSGNQLWQTPLAGWAIGSLLYSETNGIVAVTNTGLSGYQLQIIENDGVIKKEKSYRFYQTFSNLPLIPPDILVTSDGGYIITGYINPDKYMNFRDAVVFRVNDNLEMKYSKIYNGSSDDVGRFLLQLSKNHYLIGLSTSSKDLQGINYSSDHASVLMDLKETITEK